MPTYDSSDRYALRALTGVNVGSDIDAGFTALRDDISAKMVGYSSGPIGSRPTSTVGTPGIAGRRYRATDTGELFEDTGTSWIEIAVGMHAARASRNTVQSVAHNGFADVTMNTESYDTSAMFAASRTYIEIPADGIYSVKAWALWPTNATGLRSINIVRTNSGGTDLESFEDMRAALSGTQTRVSITMDFDCDAGDRILMRAFQTSGGALDLTGPNLAVAFLAS